MEGSDCGLFSDTLQQFLERLRKALKILVRIAILWDQN